MTLGVVRLSLEGMIGLVCVRKVFLLRNGMGKKANINVRLL